MNGLATRLSLVPILLGWGCAIYSWLARPNLPAEDANGHLVVGSVGMGLILTGLTIFTFAPDESRKHRIFGAVGTFVGGGLIAVAVLLLAYGGLCTYLVAGFSGENQALKTSAVLLPPPLVALTLGAIMLRVSGRSTSRMVERSHGDEPA